MLRFFWQTRLNPDPSGFTRFGRVLHWFAAFVAGLVLIGLLVAIGAGVNSWLQGDMDRWGHSQGLSNATGSALFTVPALIFYFLGRALRYIFSGE